MSCGGRAAKPGCIAQGVRPTYVAQSNANQSNRQCKSSAMQCEAMRSHVKQCSAMQSSAQQCEVMSSKANQCNAKQCKPM
eukprot:6212853-Pyramimonas_sp.AAC.1